MSRILDQLSIERALMSVYREQRVIARKTRNYSLLHMMEDQIAIQACRITALKRVLKGNTNAKLRNK